ncbi:electron transport complex subunit RsxE [Rheinheimera sp. SA_1]|jgi:electron transport complex protein RnfE|uniref:electron transport complex subunit E n=1 Tax=Rheinheimera sp. SA_1 TaxID=1827365 RepID=UPI000801DEB3|nr:electron transport complex subunit E [Rheinheimera sp. SA_1]OBP15304.1 electron transport complex subunit RsxE [Rheinheimera sp. SA_1]
MSDYRNIIHQGLWQNNPGLVQLLGLCPLLATSSTMTNALGLGFATMLVLVSTNLVVSLIRSQVPNEIRIPIFVMVIAAVVTAIEQLMQAYTYQLYQSLGIFIPLIVTNCIVIGRAEAFASKNPLLPSIVDGLMMGLGFTLVLFLLGTCRELLGQGTLFDGAEALFGPWATVLRVEVFKTESHFLLAILPPGAFMVLGFLIAAKNAVDARQKSRQVQTAGITRARVTHVASNETSAG